MKLTICNNPRKLAFLALLVCGASTSGLYANTTLEQQTPPLGWRDSALNMAKRVIMTLPYSMQKRTAQAINSISSLKEEAIKWRLKLLVQDFLDMNNETPLAYYADEFTAIVNDNLEYFKTLLFEHALKADTPDKDKVVAFILQRLNKVKHSKSVAYIKAMLYLPVRKWVRTHSAIPTDTTADAALTYHAKFNRGTGG